MGFSQYRQVKPDAPRELPQVDIAGTLFYSDIARHEFRQVDNAANRITMGDIKEEMGFSHFLYDTRTKNLYLEAIGKLDAIPEYVRIIIVPPLKDIDPEGLAKRQGYPYKEERKRQPLQLAALESQRRKPAKRKGV